MFRFLNLILVVLILLLQVRLWWGENSLPEHWQLEARIAEREAANKTLAARNQVLAAEVTDLNSGMDAIEERARYELGMVRPNETFFLLMEPAAPESPASEPASGQGVSALSDPEVVHRP